MSREDPQMKIRLPDELKREIEAAAQKSGRSMNAEIVARLQTSFEGTPSQGIPKWYTAMGEITQRISGLLILDVLEHVPPALHESELMRTARDFAHGMAREDTRALSRALATLLLKKPEDIQKHEDLMTELEPVIAAKERGEDLAPYREADLARIRAMDQRKNSAGEISTPLTAALTDVDVKHERDPNRVIVAGNPIGNQSRGEQVKPNVKGPIRSSNIRKPKT